MENQNQNANVIFSGDNPNKGVAPISLGQEPLASRALSLDPQATAAQSVATAAVQPPKKVNPFVRAARRADVILALLLIVGSLGLVLNAQLRQDTEANNAAGKFDTTQIPLEDFITPEGVAFGVQSVTVNGSLQANGGLVIAPSLQPSNARAGQLYYDQASNSLAYYNGSSFVSVGGGVQGIGGLTGQINVGGGLSVDAGQLSNSGVVSLQGLTGNVELTPGNGIAINGTTIANSGIVSVTSNSPTITVANDGNGNITLGGSGSGTVTSSGGTAGRVPIFTGSQNIEDSIIAQSGITVTVTGDLAVVTGGLTLSNALTVSNGGTGATSLALNGVLIGQGTGPITSVPAGGVGLCLLSTAGAPTWGACPGGAGVTTVNSQSGAVTIANASGAGGVITIDDASTSAKGIAQFNGTNFSVAGGAVNTIQDINTGATPTFAGLNTNIITPGGGMLTVGASGQQLILQGNANTQLTAAGDGFTTTVSFNGTATGNVNYRFDRAVTAGTYDICTTAGNCVGTGGGVSTSGGTTNRLAKFTAAQTIADSTITDDGANVTTSVDLIIQGGSVTVGVPSTQGGSIGLADGGSVNTGTITQGSLTGNRTYTLPDVSGEFCLTTGNCSGAGSTNTLQAAYDAGNTITTSDARDLDIVLANTTTDSRFDIVVADGSTGFVSVSRANGPGVVNPAQMILVENQDVDNQVPVGIRIQAAGGGFATAIDLSDAEIDDALNIGSNNIQGTTATINFTNFDVDTSGNITAAGTMNLSNGGQYQINGTQISSANLSNDANLAKLNASQTFTGNSNTFQNAANSVNAFSVQNASGTQILTVDTSNGQVLLGASGSLDGRLVFRNVANANTVTIAPGTPTAHRTITLPDADGVVCLDTGNCAGAGATLQTAYNFSAGGTVPKIKVNSTLGGVDIQDADTSIAGDLFTVRASDNTGLGQVMFGVNSDGEVTIQSAANSTTAFRLLTQGGTAVLTGDTQNGRIVLGQGGTLAGSLLLHNTSNSNVGILQTAALGQDTTYTLPDPVAGSAEICLNTGNCLGGGAGGANTSLSNLTSVAINTTLLPGAAGAIHLGSATLPFGDLFLAGTSGTPGTNNFRITGASTGGTRTITLPDASGTVCLQSSSSCGFVAGSAANFIQNQSGGPQVANFNIVSAAAGTVGARVEGAAGQSAPVLIVRSGSTPTANTLEVQNSSGAQLFAVDASNTRVVVGSGASCTGRLCVTQTVGGSGGGTATNSYNIQSVNVGAAQTIVGQQIVVSDTSTAITNTIQSLLIDTSSSTNTSATINSINVQVPNNASGSFLTLRNGAASVLTVANNGATTLQPTANGTNTFRVNNSSGGYLLNVNTQSSIVGIGNLNVGVHNVLGGSIDTAANGEIVIGNANATAITIGRSGIDTTVVGNFVHGTGNFSSASTGTTSLTAGGAVTITAGATSTWSTSSGNLSIQAQGNVELQTSNGNRVQVGSATPDATAVLLTVDSYNNAPDPAGTNGAMYYNTTTNTFRCYQDGSWMDCITASGGFVSLQNAYTNSTGGTTPEIKLDSTRGALDIQDADTTIGANLFNVRASNGSGLGNILFGVDNTGQVTAQNTTNSSNAFRILNASSAEVFGVDTTDSIMRLLGNNTGHLSAFAADTDTISARESAAAVSVNGYLYALRGCDTSSNPTATAQYALLNSDGSNGAWGTTTALPAADCDTAAATYNGYIYVNGGSTSVYYGKVNKDGTISAWATASVTLPVAPVNHSMVAHNGYLYVIGGGIDGGGNDRNLYYAKINADGSIGSFTTVPNWLPANSPSHSSTVANGYLYVTGGINGITTKNTTYYARLNANGAPAAASTATANMSARYSHGTVAMNGYLYVIGGGDSGGTATNTVQYAPLNADGNITTAWTTDTTTMPGNRWSAGVTAVNGYVHVLGGWSGSNEENNSWYATGTRVRVGASLDLVSWSGEGLADGGTGGSLTAGDTYISGLLTVTGNALFKDGATVNNALTVQAQNNSGSTFSVADDDNTAIFSVDTSLQTGFFNNTVGIGEKNVGTSALYIIKSDEDAVVEVEATGTGSPYAMFHTGSSDEWSIGLDDSDNQNFKIARGVGFGSNNFLTINRTSGNITIGASDTAGALLVLDTKTSSGDPTGVNGAMYFNANMGTFRCYENSRWGECLGVPKPNTRRTAMMVANGSNAVWSGYGDILANSGSAGWSSGGSLGNVFLPMVWLDTSSTTNGYAGTTGEQNYGNPQLFQTSAEIGSTTSIRTWFGLTDQTLATMAGSATPAGDYTAFRFDTSAGDTTFKCVTNNDTTPTVADSGVTVSSSGTYRLEIIDFGTHHIFKINDQQVCNIAATLPNSFLGVIASVTTLANATRGIYVGWFYVETLSF